MIGKTISKFLIAGVIIFAMFISTDCKKQVRCGCGKDVVRSLVNTSANIYFSPDKATISCYIVGNQYASYTFCNPSEMAPKLVDISSGDIMLVTGSAYYDCQALSQQSNSRYPSIQQYYQIEVDDLTLDLYGKNPGNPIN